MRWIAALALALLGLTEPATAAQPFAQERIEWNRPSAPFHIIANIYYVGTDDLAVYLIVTPQGDILIDGGLPESVPLIEKNIAALGFKLRDIKFMLSSHAHFDHAGGLAELKHKTGAALYLSAADAAADARGAIDFGPSAVIPFPPVRADHIVRDGQALHLGGMTLTAHLTPGHTRGCTTYTMPIEDAGTHHDVIFYCSTTTGGNPLVGNKQYPQIADDYRRSFALLRTLKADVFLAPHARFFDAHAKAARARPGAPNPFIDPGELQRYVAASERDFEAELAKERAGGKP